LAAPVWAAIAASARDEKEAGLALAEACRGPAPADLRQQYEEGLIEAGERSAVLCAQGRGHGRLGDPARGLALLAPLIDEARESWAAAFRNVRDPLAAALRGAVVEPWSICAPVSDGWIERARKRSEITRPRTLLDAAASRPGADGAALLDEALACRADQDLELREGSFPQRWLAAYAVHGRFADARRVADRMPADLAVHGSIEGTGVTAFVLALDAVGRRDEAVRELARWIDLSPDARLFAAVLAAAAWQGALGDVAAQAAAALRRIDARVDAYRL
jgi:hypothetical protein